MDTIPFQVAPSILIVDDDEVVRFLLRQFLDNLGYTVVEAINGYDALEEVAVHDFDLVILDIAMPGIDGLGVCEQMTTSMAQSPPVLMITALDDEESVERSFKVGAVDYIPKPIRWSVLKNRIHSIIGSYRSKIELERLSKNYELILDAADNGICGLDKDQKIIYINPAALEMLGWERFELIGCQYREIFQLALSGTDTVTLDPCSFFSHPGAAKSSHFEEVLLRRKDGSSFPADCRSTPIVQDNKITGGVIIFQDITELQQSSELIRYMANHDSLTSLPNRNYFCKRLPQAISLAERNKRKLFLLFIDLDRFKPINDTYGHGIGDQVLIEVARRLQNMLRTSDSICRLGGDEFVILLESTETIEGAEHVAQMVIDSFKNPIEINDHVCTIGASAGISVYPDDSSDAETMLQHGDMAMYQAKEKGRNCWKVYQQE